MGTSSSKKPRPAKPFDTEYIEFLKKKQKLFMRREHDDNAVRPRDLQFSFITVDDTDEVDWKVFYEDFLREHSDTCFWAPAMLQYFKSEFLPSEKRWIDIVFYEKFSHEILDTTHRELNIDFSSYCQSVLVEKMLLKRESKKQLHIPVPDNDQIVRNLGQCINKSLRKHENPFHILIGRFKSLFLKEYRGKLRDLNISSADDECPQKKRKEECPGSRGEKAGGIYREALANLECFVRAMMYSISLFYKGVIGEEKLIYLRELIVNAVLNCVVRGDVYDVLFVAMRLQHENEEAIIAGKCFQMREIKPQMLGINEYLCLNETSPLLRVAKENGFEASSPANKESPAKKTALLPSSAEETKTQPPLINSSVDPHASVLAPDLVLKERLHVPPYRDAIDWLRKIAQTNTPLKKLKCIAQTNSVICQCIDNFWHGTRLNPERLLIDADQYITIIIYVIIKARVPDLFTNIVLAGELAALGAKSRYNAYCLTTLQACFFHILSMEDKHVSASTKDGSPGNNYGRVEAKTKAGFEPTNGHARFLTAAADMQQEQQPRRRTSSW